MLKNGTKPTRIDHRDYGHFQTFGEIVPATFQDSYSTENGLWIPNQDTTNIFNGVTIVAMENGCTDFTSADVTNDILGALFANPTAIEAVDHANALGGIDVRSALNAAVSLKWITAYFNIQPRSLDFFDSIRLAMVSGIPEKRSVSIGTPWYPEFEMQGLGNGKTTSDGILQTPSNITPNSNDTWHNHKICGWKTINGVAYLVSKSWQGPGYGDGGYCYWSRALFNSVMTVPGTIAFTTTRGTLPPVATISSSLFQWLLSNLPWLQRVFYGI
jgi:hypothetical protein